MFSLGLVPINDIVSHECFKRLGDKSKHKKNSGLSPSVDSLIFKVKRVCVMLLFLFC